MMNKIVIFGSTGYTGLCAIKAATDKGLQIKAFVRDVTKLPDEYKTKVDIVIGNVLNYDQVLEAVKNTNGVVVVLGTRNDLSATTDMSQGLKNIIKAMKEANLEKISVCLSAFLFYEPNKVPPMFININADHQRMYDALKDSDLKYIAVFPPHIADQPYEEFQVEHNKSPGRIISKYSLGKFLVDSLDQPEHYKQICGIANLPK